MGTQPVILWGLEPFAHAVTERFVNALAQPADDTARTHLFEPRQQPIRELRRLLATLRETAASRDLAPQPRVVLLTSTFSEEAEAILALLEQVSELLGIALPGSQSMSLIVFSPPETAEEDEKVRTYKFFQHLEDRAGVIPFLDIIFVNTLSIRLYEALKDRLAPETGALTQHPGPEQESTPPTEALAAHPAPPIEDTAVAEISELLYRQLIDPDLEHLRQSVGYHAIRNRATAGDRKCAYSTAGSYRLVYLAEAGMAHLASRFQHALFHQGLMNRDAVTDEELAFIQGRADRFVESQLAQMNARLPAIPPVTGAAVRRLEGDDPWSNRLFDLEEEVNATLHQVTKQTEEALSALDGSVENAFITFLSQTPRYLAGAQFFMEALRGRRLIADAEDDDDVPSGRLLFEHESCAVPFFQALHSVFDAHLDQARSSAAVTIPARTEETSLPAWMVQVLRALETGVDADPPETTAPAHYFTRSFSLLLAHLSASPESPEMTRALVQDLGEALAAAGEQLRTTLEDRRSTKEEVKQQLETYSWFGRTISRRADFQEAEAQADALQQEMKATAQAYSLMHRLFLEQLNEIVLPMVIRARMAQRFTEEVRHMTRVFHSYVQSIQDPLEEAWETYEVVPEYRTAIAATVLNRSRLDMLYEGILKGQGMTKFAERLFSFFPTGIPEETLSYQECRNLHDHFEHGSPSLLDRLRDYATFLLQPVRPLETLDIIELEGKEAALRYLSETVDKARSFLRFAPALMPLVESRDVMSTYFVVRTHGGAASRLSEEASYAFLFRPQHVFVDSETPHEIHITCLMFGFPAFLIHALHESRKLAQKQETQPSIDLWPDQANI